MAKRVRIADLEAQIAALEGQLAELDGALWEERALHGEAWLTVRLLQRALSGAVPGHPALKVVAAIEPREEGETPCPTST